MYNYIYKILYEQNILDLILSTLKKKTIDGGLD